MAYISVDASDFDSEDLIEVLKYRGYSVYDEPREEEPREEDDDFLTDSLNVIYEKLRNGQDYTAELKKLIYEKIGRIA